MFCVWCQLPTRDAAGISRMEEQKGRASAGNKEYAGLSCVREFADVSCVLSKGMLMFASNALSYVLPLLLLTCQILACLIESNL